MLVLTRKIDESVMIGDDAQVIVRVLGVQGNQVKLGFVAPKDVAVHREEIFNKIQSEQDAA